jgi:hypothetical protein
MFYFNLTEAIPLCSSIIFDRGHPVVQQYNIYLTEAIPLCSSIISMNNTV